MFLTKEERPPAGEFIAGGLWQAMKRALDARKPGHSEAGESTETASQRAFERKGYERCLEDIEKLSREEPPVTGGPIPETLLDPKD